MKLAAAFVISLMALGAALPAAALELVEPPYLEAKVAAGDLPAVAERIPDIPSVVTFEGERRRGAYGGDLRMLMAKQKDIRMMVVYGYARLIGYDIDLNLVPDILLRVDIEEGRIFTLYLRPGHKWSDGAAFTTEDFRYYWEDVVNNETISPFGLPKILLIDGEGPVVEFIDETTLRYSWSKPNPFFLPALAGARPFYIYRPARYLKQFHARYNDPEVLAKNAAKARAKGWAGLHQRRDHQYRSDNPDLPTLQPWVNTTRPPSDRYVFIRNPYFYRIDEAGLQLPYIDRLVIDIASNKLIAAKAAFGEADLQARYIRFDNYTFLKLNEKKHDFETRLWRTIFGSQFALFPNLNVSDPVWRDLMRDVRFRRAISLAIDREQINQVIFYGLARESNNTMLEESPLYKDEYRVAWASYDMDQANALLDDIGLTARDDDGIRLLPNGEPMEIIVDTTGESTEETDILELIQDNWRDVGIAMFTKPSQREVFRLRIYSGEAMMSVWSGFANGVSTAAMSPADLAPTVQDQYQWPKWGQYVETAGSAGLEIEMPMVQRLADLNNAWQLADSDEERRDIWHRMLKIHSEQMFSIGTLNGVLQPVVVSNQLRNVPKVGIYSWEPSAFFGIYKLDSFWFNEARRGTAQ